MVMRIFASLLVSLFLVNSQISFPVDVRSNGSPEVVVTSLAKATYDTVHNAIAKTDLLQKNDEEVVKRLPSDAQYGGDYYLKKPNEKLEGWWKYDCGDTYFFKDGVIQKGWLELDGETYYLDAIDGALAHGWTKVDDQTYYFDENGQTQHGMIPVDNETYCFDDDGVMQVGFVENDGKFYYFGEFGTLGTGLLKLRDGTFYANADGVIQTGLQTIDDMSYYFDENGRQVLGRQFVDEWNGYYYFLEDGGCDMNAEHDGHKYGPYGAELVEEYTSQRYTFNGTTTYFDEDWWGYGRLWVPEVGICVALYQCDLYDETTDCQYITDCQDSACYLTGWGEVPFIADHWNQGFDGLYDAHPGMKAFIRHGDKTYVYECYHASHGINDEEMAYDGNGQALCDGDAGDISMYTCYNGWQNIQTVRFHLIDVLDY